MLPHCITLNDNSGGFMINTGPEGNASSKISNLGFAVLKDFQSFPYTCLYNYVPLRPGQFVVLEKNIFLKFHPLIHFGCHGTESHVLNNFRSPSPKKQSSQVWLKSKRKCRHLSMRAVSRWYEYFKRQTVILNKPRYLMKKASWQPALNVSMI